MDDDELLLQIYSVLGHYGNRCHGLPFAHRTFQATDHQRNDSINHQANRVLVQ